MNSRFLRPNVVWAGIWVAIFMLIFSLAYWQSKLYWKNSFEKVQQREFKMLHAVLPYALGFLEERDEPGLIAEVLNADQELFTVVYTDPTGAIKYPARSPGSPLLDSGSLSNYKFSYVPKNPFRAGGDKSSPGRAVSAGGRGPEGEAETYGKLYLIAKSPPAFRESLWRQDYLRHVWPGESFLGFTIIGYFLVLVGFAAICSITAKFQSHFQSALEEQHRSELETRDLRIQVLESNLKTLDLKLQLLDQEHEKALTTSKQAKRAIDRLARKLQSESTRNEELEKKLSKARLEHENALKAIRAINEDIDRVAAEKRQLETMRQAGQAGHQDFKPQVGAKEYLWLNLVYKNLAFSKRALQNIVAIQYAHDIFPSLPDALSALNRAGVDSLISGEGIPSRSVVRYTQPLQHLGGHLWEYRFSRDGRIFFGLSRSRTWNIDTILLKRHFSHNRHKYEKYLENTLGKDNNDIRSDLSH